MLKIKYAAAAVAFALAVGSAPLANAGALESRMEAVFGDMINVSRPGVFESQRRGVLSGGSMYVRSPIMNTNLINLQAPSWKADCGGIDFFGGSFSFINADQFVQLLRTVAANAKGYAFQMALNWACSDCMAWINNLQSKIQRLNEQMGNSCQLAKGLVNDVAGAFGYKAQNDYSLIGTASGLYQDFFGSSHTPDGSDTRKNVDEKKPEAAKNVVGNLVWDALKEGNVKGWIVGAGNEKEEYELLMSVTGTVIVPKSEEDTKNPDTGNTTKPKFLNSLISFDKLIDGGKLDTYVCNDDACLDPTQDTINVTGMAFRIKKILDGADGSVGVVAKFGMARDNAFTTVEANLMSNMPGAMGAIVRQLSTASPTVAKDETGKWAYAIAMDLAHSMLRDQITAVRQAMRGSAKDYAKEVMAMLDAAERKLMRDYEAASKSHTTIEQVVANYNAVQKNIYKVAVAANENAVKTPAEGK